MLVLENARDPMLLKYLGRPSGLDLIGVVAERYEIVGHAASSYGLLEITTLLSTHIGDVGAKELDQAENPFLFHAAS